MVGFVGIADLLGSASVKCTGVHHMSGNTRWSRNWFATLKSGKNAYTLTTSISVIGNSTMHKSCKVYLTDNQSVTRNTKKYAKCTYSNSKVTVKFTNDKYE